MMASDVQTRLGQFAQTVLFVAVLLCVSVIAPTAPGAAPYAAMVIDARSGKVLHSRNADTQLHPASLTKMMTLYVVFEAIKRGEISPDTVITISAKAAAEPPSKLGLRKGQRIKLRYLIRAGSVKSANDAATALGEAISGSEAAFARRMNRTAKALGMNRTHFKNAHGLTESGHMSTARDMTTLGRHLFFDHPEYYNLFSRRTTNAGMREVANTNTRFLNAYRGADGIKTGYTRAAGFNLVASAQRGQERIITTVFGGRSTAARNAKVAELMDLGFRRAPSRAKVNRPGLPAYSGEPAPVARNGTSQSPASGKTIRLVTAVKTSPRPVPRPSQTIAEPAADVLVAIQASVSDAVAEATQTAEAAPEVLPPALPDTAPEIVAEAIPDPVPTPPVETANTIAAAFVAQPVVRPTPRPATIVLASVSPLPEPALAEPEIVTRLSSSGGRHWGINVGRYPSQYQAQRVLLKTALVELNTLDEALRKVVNRKGGFDANFVGMTKEGAQLACRRLTARNSECNVIGPS